MFVRIHHLAMAEDNGSASLQLCNFAPRTFVGLFAEGTQVPDGWLALTRGGIVIGAVQELKQGAAVAKSQSFNESKCDDFEDSVADLGILTENVDLWQELRPLLMKRAAKVCGFVTEAQRKNGYMRIVSAARQMLRMHFRHLRKTEQADSSNRCSCGKSDLEYCHCTPPSSPRTPRTPRGNNV